MSHSAARSKKQDQAFCLDYSDVGKFDKVSVKFKLILGKLGQKFSMG